MRLVTVAVLGVAALSACAGSGAIQTARPSGAASAVPSAAGSAPSSPSGASPSAAQRSDIDLAFIDMMVPHHQSAIEMAQIALERAENDELKTLAEDVIEAQRAEIDQLKSWREQWFGSDQTPPMDAMPMMPGVEMPEMSPMPGMSQMPTMSPTPGMSEMPGMSPQPMTTDMTTDIEMLRTAEPFDKVFMETLIRHHEMAISAGEIVASQTAVPEMRALAEKMIDDQQAEIEQLERWLEAWYPPSS